MPPESEPRDLSRRIYESRIFRWLTILSVLVAFFGLALAIPQVRNHVFNERANLIVRLDGSIPVLGINRQVSGLTVNYEGNDLFRSGQELNAVRISIENTGGSSINSSDLTAKDPIGFKVNGGRIVKINQFIASSRHLMAFSSPNISGNSVAISSDIIIDGGDKLTFDLLIIKNNNENLSIVPIGKVAGIDEISFVDGSSKERKTIFEEAIEGNVWAQVLRLLIYTFAFVLMLALGVAVGTQVSGWRDKRRWAKVAKDARSQLNSQRLSSPEFDFLLSTYERHGEYSLWRLGHVAGLRGAKIRKDFDVDNNSNQYVVPEHDLAEEMLVLGGSPFGARYGFLAEAKEKGFLNTEGECTAEFQEAFDKIFEMVRRK